MSSRVFVLLPVYNRLAITLQFVADLKSQTYPAIHLLLINDGDPSAGESVRALYPETTVLQGKGDWWWGGSLHQGYLWLKSQAQSSDSVLLINDDTRIGPDFVANGVRHLVEDPLALVVARTKEAGGKSVKEAAIHTNWSRLQFRTAEDPAKADCAPTRGLFLRFGAMQEIGGFHPVLLPHYLSDYEYTLRAHKKGLLIRSFSDVVLEMDRETTGLHDERIRGLGRYLWRIFRKRSSMNPLYFSSFILMASPWIWIVPNLMRIWYVFLRQAGKAALRKSSS